MTTAALILIAAILLACILSYALARTTAQSDRAARRAHVDYLMGDPPCRVCGKPSPYSDRRGPLHPGCREGITP